MTPRADGERSGEFPAFTRFAFVAKSERHRDGWSQQAPSSPRQIKAYLGTLGFRHAKFQEPGTKNPFRHGDVTFAKCAEALDPWTGPRGERLNLKGDSKPEAANDWDAWGHGT